MAKKRYGKLVRDKIPSVIRGDGGIPNTRVLAQDEFRNELLYKIIEEAEELRKVGEYDEGNLQAISEEVGDVLEVLYAIIEEFGLDEAEIEMLRRKKLEEFGAFKEKVFLESVIKD